jgi:hypothetical protein
LIDIYYTTESITEFFTLADELQQEHRDEQGRQIMRMGKIIAPQELRFSGPRSVGSKEESA